MLHQSHLPVMYIEKTRSKMNVSTIPNSEHQNIISEPPPYHLRIAYFISVWSFKAAIAFGLRARRLFSRRPPNLLRPEVKSYLTRPFLKNRIFRPDGSGDEPLPLYLDVHGGGWAVADPETDDEFCSFIAQNFHIIVVSIDYRKAPSWKFPYAVSDVAAIADAVIRDESLNIDNTKVVMGGFSAGGNLAFAASQVESLKGRVYGLVGFYPCLDLTESLDEKLKRRPKEARSDILESSANFLDWAYVPYGVNRRDPLLSPRWARREDLPQYVYLIGAEYDMLCHEANQMAKSLADPELERTSIPALLAEDGWKQGGIRWECARGRLHAFTHVAMRGRKEIDRVKAVQEMYYRVGVWLKEEVWANQSLR
jgi:acetyl esterase/lipase